MKNLFAAGSDSTVKWSKLFLTATLMLSLVLFVGCSSGNDDDDDELSTTTDTATDTSTDEDETAEFVAHAEEHMKDGPFENVSATSSTDDAPLVGDTAHTTYVIALDTAQMNFVKVESLKEADYRISLSESVTLSVLDSEQNAVEIEESTEITDSDYVKAHHVVELETGTYYFQIQGDSVESISFYWEADDHDHDSEEHDETEQAIEHAQLYMDEGPFVNVSAASTTQDAPAVADADHTTYVITLVANEANYVKYESAEASDYRISLSESVTFSVLDNEQNAVEIEESHDITTSVFVKAHHVIELEVGTYYFNLESANITSLNFYLDEAGDHAHE